MLDVAGWARSRDAETPPDLVDLLESSPATQERVTDLVRSAPPDGVGWVRPDDVRLLAPVRPPNSVRQVVARDGAVPVFTHANRRAVLGPGDTLAYPPYTEKLDFSCQVAAVVGRRGRDLSPSDALTVVFGYTLMTQWSARDVAREVATALGPWVVTPDEWEPRAEHPVEVTLSGSPVHSGTTLGRPWTFGQALSWVSQAEDVWPTDVVGLGPASGASGRDRDRWVRPGDDLVLSLEGLGALTTRLSTASTSLS